MKAEQTTGAVVEAPRSAELQIRYEDRLIAPTRNPYALTLRAVPPENTDAHRSLRKNLLFGLAVLLVIGGGAGALVYRTEIAGAVIANGVLAVEAGHQEVQHPAGGTISEIRVKEDQRVAAGEVLVRMDGTVAAAQLLAAENALLLTQARLARLMAERDNLNDIDFSSVSPTQTVTESQRNGIFADERQQFKLRREERNGQRSGISEQIVQTKEQIVGYETQLEAAEREAVIITGEVEGLRGLYKKKLVNLARLSEAESRLSNVDSRRGALKAAISSARAKIAELELAIIQVDQTLRSSLTNEIAAAQVNLADWMQKAAVARKAADNLELKAPLDGVVHNLAIHTLGGVVGAGQTLMTIIPDRDRLIGDLKIRPSDIDQLYPGQLARINFSAFDRGSTPELNGELQSVSPDLITDERSGVSYYTAKVDIEASELEKLNDLKLVPGMPVEVFIRTNSRTILSYLVKPIVDQFNRAFRE